jgi:hypothetical protein
LQCTGTTSKAIALRTERLTIARLAKYFLAGCESRYAQDIALLSAEDLLAIFERFIAQVCAVKRLQMKKTER